MKPATVHAGRLPGHAQTGAARSDPPVVIEAHLPAVVGEVAGVADLLVEQQVDVGTIRFVLNREALARHGLRVDDVTRAIETWSSVSSGIRIR